MEVFDYKVKHPAVNLERRVRRHRTTDSPRLIFRKERMQDGLHATEGPAATSVRPCSRRQSRDIWRVTAQAAERTAVFKPSEACSALTAKAGEPRSLAHASR